MMSCCGFLSPSYVICLGPFPLEILLYPTDFFRRITFGFQRSLHFTCMFPLPKDISLVYVGGTLVDIYPDPYNLDPAIRYIVMGREKVRYA